MIAVIQGDITQLRVDAIVNAANQAMRGGGGVNGAIHDAAGPELLCELLRFPGCPTGSAVITSGHLLPAKHVIHAVGPVWRGGDQNEADLLRSAYQAAFTLAREAGVRSIALPAISTGVFGYPKRPAARIALETFLLEEQGFERIIACLFDPESRAIYEEELTRLRGA